MNSRFERLNEWIAKGLTMNRRVAFLGLALVLATSTTRVFGQRAIYLVRHAEKAGDDLTPKGKMQAEQLATLLKDSGITVIYTSQFERTKKTAEPLVQKLKGQGLSVRQEGLPLSDDLLKAPEDPALLAEHGKQAVKTLKESSAADIVLIVGHDVTVPAIIKALGSNVPAKIETTEFDRLFLVVPRGDSDPRPPGLFQLLHYAN
jgi:broad specificity phosphatase PhoE